MRDIIKNKSTGYTSTAFKITQNAYAEVYVQVTGVCSVAIESLSTDGTWRSFPETTLTGPTAQVVCVPQGDFRVKVLSGTATAVEVFW